MAKYNFDISPVLGTETFTEASREELRVLIAFTELGGVCNSDDALAKAAGVSKARAVGAVALWREAGILKEKVNTETESDNVTLEFEERLFGDTIDEEDSRAVALEIRNKGLADLISECAKLMKRPNLNTQEIKHIIALHSQLALSPEYVITLAAHLAASGKLTAKRLSDKASKLVEKGIDTTEDLEKYIATKESETGAGWEFRHILGIYNRNLSKSEHDYFKRWAEDYGYSVGIVGEAYDLTILNTGKQSLSYMDAILTRWHECGCKTVEDCIARVEADKAAKQGAKEVKNNSKAKKAHPEAQTPRYGDFNSEDALMKALARSYGEPNTEN